MLLPEYQSNDNENCLVSFSICLIRFRNLPSFNRSFLPVELGTFSAESLTGKPAKTSDNNEQDLPSFSFLLIMINDIWISLRAHNGKLAAMSDARVTEAYLLLLFGFFIGRLTGRLT